VLAKPASLEGFSFYGLPSVAPNCARGGVRVVSELVDSRVESLGPYPQADERWGSDMLQVSQSRLDRRVDGSGKSATTIPGFDLTGEPTLPNPTRVYVPVARHREHK
jgi:hypothetical protein